MPENMRLFVGDAGITRRTFLKGSLGAGLLLLAAQAAAVAGCRSAPPTTDLTITSSVDNNHSHKVAIPGADIDSAPSEKTYTSDGANHTHAITLTKAEFATIKSGQAVAKTSTRTGPTPHTHTFAVKV